MPWMKKAGFIENRFSNRVCNNSTKIIILCQRNCPRNRLNNGRSIPAIRDSWHNICWPVHFEHLTGTIISMFIMRGKFDIKPAFLCNARKVGYIAHQNNITQARRKSAHGNFRPDASWIAWCYQCGLMGYAGLHSSLYIL